jgi:hypothetical protein
LSLDTRSRSVSTKEALSSVYVMSSLQPLKHFIETVHSY